MINLRGNNRHREEHKPINSLADYIEEQLINFENKLPMIRIIYYF
ncbi:hypothetical protein [cyanobacterium endosymbiont of Rhopalodia gibberula]|nr:hypothetical protein [cyanobacterium endosymbiont of Rhopalodia gibberula]